MTTGKVYLSRYYFCFIPLHLVFSEIDGSLLHFTMDVCVYVCACICVCAHETGKEEGNPILQLKCQKKINVYEMCHMRENC